MENEELNAESKEREEIERGDEESLAAVMPPSDIVVFNEMRSCNDLFMLYEKGVLDIKPDFQRGLVWSIKDRSLFVDSLIKQLPIPSICISWDSSTGKRLVIDGLQRISTIISFLDYQNNDWRISKIDGVDSRLAGKLISEVHDHETRLFQILEECTLPVTVIRCDYRKKEHMEYLFQIFSRLNTGGRRLLYQEIRNCVYQGPFNEFLKSYVRSEIWCKFANISEAQVDSCRFGNEERLLRILAFHDRWEEYKSGLARYLNNYMGKKRNSSEEEINAWKDMLDRLLTQINRITNRKDVRRNWNLVESVLVGMSKNLEKCEQYSDDEINSRYNLLVTQDIYTEGMKEGVMHTIKVLSRIQKAIEAFQ